MSTRFRHQCTAGRRTLADRGTFALVALPVYLEARRRAVLAWSAAFRMVRSAR